MAPHEPAFVSHVPRLTRILRAPHHPLPTTRRPAHGTRTSTVAANAASATPAPAAPLSLSEIAHLHRSGTTSVTETLNKTLQRSSRINPHINALLSIDADAVLARANNIDAAIAEGRDPGLLAGVPIVVKDNLCVAGQPTTAGSASLDGFTPPYSATAVQRLEAEGAIVLGKANMDEFGMGSSTETSAYGATRNPLDLTRVPGGSSGGSAAAVAASIAPAALGTDTGGSVRHPAALCGVSGLRPSYGRVPRHGLLAYASSFDTIGPIAHSVNDLALLLSVMAGRDNRDATAVHQPAPSPTVPTPANPDRPLADLRVGLVREAMSSAVHPAVRDVITAALSQLESLGAVIVDVSLPRLEPAVAAYYTLAFSESSANLARYDGVRYGVRDTDASTSAAMYTRSRAAGFGAEARRRILAGTYTLSSGYYDAYFRRAMQIRRLVADDLQSLFEQVDVLATPVAQDTAYRIGEKIDDPVQMYLEDIMSVPASLAGVPALAVPCGFVHGLPVGMQVIAPYLREDLALCVGQAFQASTTHHIQTFALADKCLLSVA